MHSFFWPSSLAVAIYSLSQARVAFNKLLKMSYCFNRTLSALNVECVLVITMSLSQELQD